MFCFSFFFLNPVSLYAALSWADILVKFAMFVMQNYLTDVWNLGFTHAAGILNIWGGISMILPLCFQILVNAYIGNFNMLVISSIAYSLVSLRVFSRIIMLVVVVAVAECPLVLGQVIPHKICTVYFYAELKMNVI